MANRTMTPEPDIRELRKAQALKALDTAKVFDTYAFIGELNDDAYYLVIQEETQVTAIQEQLEEFGIQTSSEYRNMSNDIVLYLLDSQKPETKEETI